MAFDENVPLAANQISADIVSVNANWEFLISGDGTAGRVLRVMRLKVEEGTNANTIKCTPLNVWNATTTPGTTDNITKDGVNTGNYNLAADGLTLLILAAGLGGNAVAVLSANIWANTSTVTTDLRVEVASNDIVIRVYDATNGDQKDIEDHYVEAGTEFYIYITYITSA